MDVRREYERLIEDGEIEGRDAAVLVLAAAVGDVAHQLCLLGNAGAITSMGTELGAIEALGMAHKECAERLAETIDGLTQEIGGLKGYDGD